MPSRHLFTSESVTEGHPDKLADQISDAVLDKILADDPDGRVACETFLTTGLVLVAGEISTETYVDVPKVVRDTVTGVGYTDARSGMDGATSSPSGSTTPWRRSATTAATRSTSSGPGTRA